MKKLLPILLFALSLTAASAQQVPSPGPLLPLPAEAPMTPPAAAGEASIHAYGDSEKACLEWNDGCRTCRRPENGEPMCSNIGIACQASAIQCTRRTDEKR